MKTVIVTGALALMLLAAPVLAQDAAAPGGGRGAPQQWWSYKGRGGVYTAPNKPLVKLADLKRAHAGQNNWQEVVVRNAQQEATYNSAAPGTAVGRSMHTDTPVLFVVVAGEIHFAIEGQAPITATRGSLVTILESTIFSYTVAGTQNALWVEVDPVDYKAVYPATDAAPPARSGSDIMKVTFTHTPGAYAGPNAAHWNLFATVAACAPTGVRVNLNRIYASALSGYANPADPANTCPSAGRGGLGPLGPAPANPASPFGHMHAGMAEWWIVQSGRIAGRIENAGEFVGEEGDILYAPPMSWHQMGFQGPGLSERLAIAPYIFNNMNGVTP